MKRIKIMLLSLFVLAAVGGVLAFKVKLPNFCTYQIDRSGACPIQPIKPAVITTAAGGDVYTLVNNGDCPPAVDPALCTLSITYTTD